MTDEDNLPHPLSASPPAQRMQWSFDKQVVKAKASLDADLLCYGVVLLPCRSVEDRDQWALLDDWKGLGKLLPAPDAKSGNQVVASIEFDFSQAADAEAVLVLFLLSKVPVVSFDPNFRVKHPLDINLSRLSSLAGHVPVFIPPAAAALENLFSTPKVERLDQPNVVEAVEQAVKRQVAMSLDRAVLKAPK